MDIYSKSEVEECDDGRIYAMNEEFAARKKYTRSPHVVKMKVSA